MRKPGAILFDVGGTLLSETALDLERGIAAIVEHAENPRGISLAELTRVAEEIRGATDARREVSQLEFTTAALFRHLFDRFGLRCELSTNDLTLRYWRAAVTMTPEPGVHDALASLREQGVRLAVISNSMNGEIAIKDELRRHGLRAPFEFVIASADYGVRKPDPLIFGAALGRLDLDASEVWFVGDSLANDVAGAQRVGMRAIWYAPASADAGDHVPDARITSLGELPLLTNEA